jgi:uncharacterized protein with HEPN domain
MLPSDIELLRHILDEVDFALDATEGKTKEEVIEDGIICRAIVRSIEIMGEATKRISEEFKSAHPQIEWKKMAGTRDRLIHDYFGVDYDIIWSIVTNKIPNLKDFIEDVLPDT